MQIDRWVRRVRKKKIGWFNTSASVVKVDPYCLVITLLLPLILNICKVVCICLCVYCINARISTCVDTGYQQLQGQQQSQPILSVGYKMLTMAVPIQIHTHTHSYMCISSYTISITTFLAFNYQGVPQFGRITWVRSFYISQLLKYIKFKLTSNITKLVYPFKSLYIIINLSI